MKLVDTLDLKSSDCNGRTGSSPVPSTKASNYVWSFFYFNPFRICIFELYSKKMSAFVISKRINDEYKFEFTSRRGKVIFTSNSFELKFECENEIEFLKNSIDEAVFLKVKSSRDKFYFRLIIREKEMAVSRKYTTQLLLQKGIDEIVKYTSKSETLDFSSNDLVFFDDLEENKAD